MNKGQLREWAGTTTFDRGERLAKLGHVYDYVQAPDRVQAKVQGEYWYDVELIQPDDREQAKATCTCPASGYQPICKHAIATYLVYFGEYQGSSAPLEEPTIELPSYKATLNWIKTLDRDELLEIIQSQLQDNPPLRESLVYRCFIEQQNNHFTPQQVTELIDEALPLEWAWGFEEASAYFDHVQHKLDALNHALRSLPAKPCYQLAWYAIVRLNTVSIEYVDTSYGEQYSAYELFLEVLFSALGQSDESTQDKLNFIVKALNTPIDINDTADFLHSLETYAKDLSQAIRQILEDDEENNIDFTAASMLMHHYRREAEKEEHWQEAISWLLKVELNDTHWLTMGHYHLHLKQYAQATRCLSQARKLMGTQHFHYAKSTDLECAIAKAQQDSARMWEIRWDQFQDTPTVRTIGYLNDLASEYPTLAPHYQTNILTFLEAGITNGGKSETLFLLIDSAIQYQHIPTLLKWCEHPAISVSQLTKIAQKLGADHHNVAFNLYQRAIAETANRANNQAYLQAVVLLSELKALPAPCKDTHLHQWQRFLAKLRLDMKRKRNFIRYLDERFD